MKAIDLFAGWGGFTLGAEAAGVRVVWAANHSPLAVEAHAGNHPHTIHACQDLRQADWSTLPSFDILLASPACQGHSTASQPCRTPRHDADRSTAWAVVDCADATRPRAILVENVLRFRAWSLYPVWRQAIETLGYRAMRALDDASTVENDEPAFGPCIEWHEGPWRPVRRAPSSVRERIALAQRLHGKRCLSQHVTGHSGVSLDEPIRTITTQDQWVVVDGSRYRPLTVSETAKAMGFPVNYKCPDRAGRRTKIRGFGNAVPPPMAQALVERIASVA